MEASMPMTSGRMTFGLGFLVLAAGVFSSAIGSLAQEAVTVHIAVKNHQFQPTEIRAPARKPIILRIRNLDSAPIEFESVSLRVEKVVTAQAEGIINLRALAPGRYEFFDDFHQETRGLLIVQ
jgi:Cupredoxin-like domain